MTFPLWRRTLPLTLVAVVLAGLALAVTAHAGGAQRLVVRGDATVTEGGCAGGVCELRLTGGRFRGTPVGGGAYDGSLRLKLAEMFPNGEGGVCAPIHGRVTLGVGSPNRLVLALSGASCQDGAGDPTTTAFTGVARFAVVHGTGTHAGASGGGVMTSSEDPADHDRMTLIGRLARR